MEIQIELTDRQIDDVFRSEMELIFKILKDDYKRRKNEDGMAIFHNNKEKDIKQLKKTIKAFKTVMDYCI